MRVIGSLFRSFVWANVESRMAVVTSLMQREKREIIYRS